LEKYTGIFGETYIFKLDFLNRRIVRAGLLVCFSSFSEMAFFLGEVKDFWQPAHIDINPI
jgi:hypothetical protein